MKKYLPYKDSPEGVKIIFTGVHEGSIATGAGKPDTPEHGEKRAALIQQYFDTDTHHKLLIGYSSEHTYTHVEQLEEMSPDTVAADALYTTISGKVIALPVADCIATVVYDPKAGMVGVLHLGRHASLAGLIESFAIEVADRLGSDPRDWWVWMSPSLKQPNDRMDYFDPPHPSEWEPYMKYADDGKIHIDITGHNVIRFERLGVSSSNIMVSPENTYTDTHYFSQRAADETGDQLRFGRMMVAAQLNSKK